MSKRILVLPLLAAQVFNQGGSIRATKTIVAHPSLLPEEPLLTAFVVKGDQRAAPLTVLG